MARVWREIWVLLACRKPADRARFGSIYTKVGTIQRSLAWALRKDDMQIHEVFHILPLIKNKIKFKIKEKKKRNYMYVYVCLCGGGTYREKHA